MIPAKDLPIVKNARQGMTKAISRRRRIFSKASVLTWSTPAKLLMANSIFRTAPSRVATSAARRPCARPAEIVTGTPVLGEATRIYDNGRNSQFMVLPDALIRRRSR